MPASAKPSEPRVFEREPGVELHQVLDRYYAPDNTHRTDGKALNRGEFAEMVAHVRNQVTGGTVTVLNEVSDGATYAERYVFHIDLANGTAQDREVAIFGSFAEDGREFLTSLPPDPMVRMLSHSAGTVRPFVDLAKAQFTSLTLPPRSREL